MQEENAAGEEGAVHQEEAQCRREQYRGDRQEEEQCSSTRALHAPLLLSHAHTPCPRPISLHPHLTHAHTPSPCHAPCSPAALSSCTSLLVSASSALLALRHE
jgi:hypothetical protein